MLDRIERSLARHVQQPGAAPLLLVVDDNMYYRSMRYEVHPSHTIPCTIYPYSISQHAL